MTDAYALVLHSHLPYVRGAGRWPHGEEWVHEAILGTYLPLLACYERQHLSELQALAHRSGGLLLGLDGLAPEGGEPQLWIVRELHTGWTLRSGWLASQEEATFAAFLQPIAALGLPVLATPGLTKPRILASAGEL